MQCTVGDPLGVLPANNSYSHGGNLTSISSRSLPESDLLPDLLGSTGRRVLSTEPHGLQGVPQGGQRRLAARSLGACSRLTHSSRSVPAPAPEHSSTGGRLAICDQLGRLPSAKVNQVQHPAGNSVLGL